MTPSLRTRQLIVTVALFASGALFASKVTGGLWAREPSIPFPTRQSRQTASSISAVLPLKQEPKLPPSQAESNITAMPVISFDPQVLTWQAATTSAPWGPRDAHTMVEYHDQLWLMGGLKGDIKIPYEQMPHKSDVWVSRNGFDWKLVTNQAPWGPRRSMIAVVFQGKIWLMGGWSPKTGYTSDVWYSDDGEHWTLATPKAAWDAREGHTLFVFDNKLWLSGGVRFDTRELKNDVWYSEDGITWLLATRHAEWSGRYDQTMTAFSGKFWLAGGLRFGNEVLRDLWSSDDGTH